jgi:hypothetical protein
MSEDINKDLQPVDNTGENNPDYGMKNSYELAEQFFGAVSGAEISSWFDEEKDGEE